MVGSRKLSNDEVEALLSGLDSESKEDGTQQFDPNEVREFKFELTPPSPSSELSSPSPSSELSSPSPSSSIATIAILGVIATIAILGVIITIAKWTIFSGIGRPK